MLCLSLVEEIDRLLQDGTLSQRQIAHRLGVGRGTVSAIANGKRGLFGKDPMLETTHSTAPVTPAERCPYCGFTVYMPCLVCRTREYRELRRLERELAAICGRPLTRGRRRSRAIRKRGPRRSRVA